MNNQFNRSSLIGWCLFDFANSIPSVIGGIYFAKWFTIDVGGGSVLFNFLFFVSSIFIIIFGKWIGNKIDQNGYKFWIILSSIISGVTLLTLFAASQILSKQILIYISFILFLVFLFSYQISRICHNVYLRKIIPEALQSKMSGYGTASNWAGSIVGILITIPIVTNYSGIFARELTFLAAAIGFAFFTPLSLFYMFRSNVPLVSKVEPEKLDTQTWKTTFTTIGVSLFIYLLLFDVMATVQRNLPPYLTTAFRIPDDTQAIGFLIILVCALVGGLFAAQKVNFHSSETWLKISSLSLGIAIILITFNYTFTLWGSFILAGISYGILESAIRLHFMKNFAPEKAGKSFGILAVIERTSGIVGPITWIVPFFIISNEITANLSSMLLMAGLSFTALLLLLFKKVK